MFGISTSHWFIILAIIFGTDVRGYIMSLFGGAT